MSSSDHTTKAEEEGMKEITEADANSRQEQTNNDNKSLKEHNASQPTDTNPDVSADAEHASHVVTEEDQREEMREEQERQRREGTQEDQDQRHDDPDLVQEEMVPEFQEGKKRVKVNPTSLRTDQWL